ncbi:Transcription initiation factor IIA beta [Oopsacas minuta]|uniref:Transcription initiation factor IIA beta n=1 Tax=Oopsacas minuta TaxID=111878 RepID=A0AAV7KJT9_9METZ|nr:Transcription initiation factor IIA beta [Oopsacas minuta]
MAAGTANQTYNLYKSVIDEVIKNVRDAFRNEGHDEKVIIELRNAWEERLKDSEAVKVSKNDINIPDTSSTIYPHNTITKSHPINHLPMPSGSSLVDNFRSGGDERVHARELDVHSQASSLFRMKKHPMQQPHHSMHPYPNPLMHPQMYLGHPPMPPPQMRQFEKFESSLGSPEDKPSKEKLPGFKSEGKRQQTDMSMFEKAPSAKRSRMGQVDGTGGGHGTGTSGTGATGGADVIEDSTDDEIDDDDLDDDDDQSDNSEIAPGDIDSIGVRKADGAKGTSGGEAEGGKDPEGVEGDEELGSTDDDDSGDDHEDHFETENMVVCQFKKVTRTRNKWRFHLKDGIMNLNGFDQVFSQATGEADW